MKIFIDSANIDEIKHAAETICDGVTTNPTLIMKEGKDYVQTLKEITKIVNGPISAETVSLDAKGMVKEGNEFAKIHKNIVIVEPLAAIVSCRRHIPNVRARNRVHSPFEGGALRSYSKTRCQNMVKCTTRFSNILASTSRLYPRNCR